MFATAAAVLLMANTGLTAQDPPARPSIQVNGTGTVSVEPDEARVRVGVDSEAATAGEAQEGANQVAQRILDAVGELGIAPEAVQTSRLRLMPVYQASPGREQAPRITGYRAVNTVTVELRDLSRIGPVVDATIEAGANRVDGVDFGIRDDEEARRAAWTAAVEDARGKAETITAALGVPLGPVLEVYEQGINIPVVNMRMADAAMALESATPVATGRVSVTASVSIRYALGGTPPGPER
jgi:uncharacterized protein YggE